jgi:mRNA interferase HigB
VVSRRIVQWHATVDEDGHYSVSSQPTGSSSTSRGTDYRLVVAVDFEKSIVWIKWIGTHKDYDKIDGKEVQHDG